MTDPGFRLSPEQLREATALSGALQRMQSANLPNGTELGSVLRSKRREAWAQAAATSLIDPQSAETVCRFWSETADALLTPAFQECFGEGFALFALGKLGSHELNLSSDVDLLIVSREERQDSSSRLRKFQKLIGEQTPQGFVFRLDFDLRPGGRMGPLIPTVDQLVDYYGNYGETWERLAFVRLRAIAGDTEIIKNVSAFATRFSFRRHLDYTLLEDLKNLRANIHKEAWSRATVEQTDLKLGVGGIRDVELFFHALQVVHGGKDPGLRTPSSSMAAKLLAEKKILPQEEADFLISHYWKLRALENAVQAQEDQQTHILSEERLVTPWMRELIKDLPAAMKRTSEIVAGLLGRPIEASQAAEHTALQKNEDVQKFVDEVLSLPLFTRNRDRDERNRRTFLQHFLVELKKQNANTSLALDQLREFLKATRAKSSFFDLLVRHDSLVQELAWLFGHSPYLGRLLCYRPELLDAFLYRTQDLSQSDMEAWLEQMVEKRLLTEIIAGSRFLKDKDLVQATEHLSGIADEIVLGLCERLRSEISSPVRILALGKWGGRELGFRSDLDFIYVLQNEPSAEDLKFVRRFVSRLTEPHRGGSIYPIDLRLRPSGKGGPLIITEERLHQYLREEAPAWERQAYLRSRWLDKPTLCLWKDLLHRPLQKADLSELNRIRIELAKKAQGLDLKFSEGGLIDIELFVQTKILAESRELKNGNTLEQLRELKLTELEQGYSRLRQIEQLQQLLSQEATSKILENRELLQSLAALLNLPSADALKTEMHSLLQRHLDLLVRLDPRRVTG